MMKNNSLFFLLCLLLLLSACQTEENPFDATGTFEATEIIISSEVNGKILRFDAEEGDEVKQNQVLAQVDILSLELQKAQLAASVEAIGQKQNDARPQVAVLQEQQKANDAQIQTMETQLKVLQKEQARIAKLYQAEAATPQQMDQIDGQVEVLAKQIAAAQTQKSILAAQMDAAVKTVAIQNRGLSSERKPLQKKMAQLDDQMKRAQIINPTKGTILTKYVNANELVGAGRPLYKLADLSEMILRAYITGDQLSQVKTGDEVEVFVDADADSYKTYQGKVTWIASKAEFTPKTIQTKEERANLVYAIKVAVPNDGYLKIGMYGEVNFKKENSAE